MHTSNNRKFIAAILSILFALILSTSWGESATAAPQNGLIPIYDIQYTTDPSGDSPYKDQVGITTQGVVTAVFSGGYFIEDPAGGVWNGLYVYDPNVPTRGDLLQITGTVSEYYNLTEMKDLTAYTVLSSGNPLPAPQVLSTGDVSQEQWEGVLVQVQNVTVTNDSLGYGEWSVSDGSGDVVVDDRGSYSYSPSNGEAIDSITGPLDYSFDFFKIQPRDDEDIVISIDYTPIYDIQYTTDPSGDSPYKDQTDVTTEGIVTGVFYNAYFIEDPAGGAWNGLYVYDSNAVTRGDRVRITGTVAEYNNLTEMTTLTAFEIESSGNPVPGPDVLSTVDVSQEQWEGVLVQVQNVTVTNPDLGYGEWSVSDGSGDVVVDDKGSYTYFPMNGDALLSVTGPLDYSYGAFKMQPRDDADIVKMPDLLINEVDSDTPDTDVLEFIELYDGGQGNTDLTGLVVVLYNGSDDLSYTPAFDLDGYSTDAEGYFVIGNAGVENVDLVASNGFLQNGQDAVALYQGDGADFPNDTAITTENLLDAIVYDTNDADDPALLVLLNEGQPQVNEGGAGDSANHSNQRCPNGSGGARNTDTYIQEPPTPGTENCPPPPVIINEVDADTPDTDVLEFIELYDGGIGNFALDGLVVVLYNGSDDLSYTPAFDLDGYSTDENGYFVIGDSGVANVDLVASNGFIQNGQDAVALFIGDGDDFPNDTAITTENLLDAIVYDTDDADDPALLVLLNEGQPQVNEGGAGDSANHSNQRCPNGSGGARNTDTYIQELPTPGTMNCPPVDVDLEVTKDDLFDPVALSSPITYTIDVLNNGPADALTVTLTDTLPGAVTFVSVESSAGGCSESLGVVTCDLGTIPLNETVEVTITVTAPAVDQFVSNKVEVSTDSTETDPSNNQDSETTTVGDPPIPDIWINEVDSDTESTDVLEFLELYDGGVGNTYLDRLVVVFYNGNGDVSYAAYDLDGYTTNEDGYFLLGNAGVTPTPDIIFPSNGLQNGEDAVAIYHADGEDFPNNTPLTTENLLAAFVYDTSDPDDYELLTLLNPGQPQVNEDGKGDKDHHSNQRCPNGYGGLRETERFTQNYPTPGAENDCPVPPMLINEVDADTDGTDILEFVELYDGGVGNTLLNGLVVVFFNGNGDVSYAAYDLDDYITNEDGYFVLGNADVIPTPDIIFPSNGLQNGADAVAIYKGSDSDFPDGTPVTATDLMDALVYDTDDGDDPGLLDILTPGQPQINEGGAGNKDFHSNQRCPDGFGGPLNTYMYDQGTPTPGEANFCGILGACGDLDYKIHEVQGDGEATPMEGATDVIIEGVVVGDFQEEDQLKGFYVQEEDGDADGDPATSEGIFVYDPAYALILNPGDGVRLRGTAYEYYDVTQIGYVTAMTTCTPGGPASAATLDLPVADLTDFEHYEGMLVTFPDTLTASQNYFQGRYGQVTLSEGGRLYQPTQILEPGSPEMFDMVDENLRRMVVLDDDTTLQNPYPIPYIGEEDTLRAGDTLDGLVGVVDYGLITSGSDISHYRIRPVGEVNFTRVNEREPFIEGPGDNLRIASFNVLNLFNGDGLGGGFPTSRGASTIEEYDRQLAKIVKAIARMHADVIGLMEIENDAPPNSAIQDLVYALNSLTTPHNYSFIDTGVIGTDEIKVALIYKPSQVTPIGDFAILDSSVDPDYLSDLNRPALAQSFVDNASGRQFTVVVNHLKSKGSDCDHVGDPDTGDGQGNCNLTRTAAAIAEANWLAGNPTGYGEGNYIIIGDLNAYMEEDPIQALEDMGLSNLVKEHIGATAYTYIFDGGSGNLDHALASYRFGLRVAGVQIWHINADEPSVIDYNLEYKPEDLYTDSPFRASDHDPVIIDLNMSIDVFFNYIPLVMVR